MKATAMSLTHQDVVEHLRRIIDADRIIDDEATLKLASVDHYRKLQTIFDTHTMQLPAAAVRRFRY